MKPVSNQNNADNNGNCEVDFTPPTGYEWTVTQIAVITASTKSTLCQVFLNQRFMCGSHLGNQDSADGSPILVRPIDQLRVVWSNCSPGVACTAHLLLEEVPMGSSHAVR